MSYQTDMHKLVINPICTDDLSYEYAIFNDTKYIGRSVYESNLMNLATHICTNTFRALLLSIST